MPKGQQTIGFRNQDFTDRELLANIHDAVGGDGWATTTEIAVQCGYTGNGQKYKTPATKVASRLAWMRDVGNLLESTGPDMNVLASEPGARDTRWRLTTIGEQIRRGNLSRAVDGAIERMDSGSKTLMMRKLMQEGFVRGDHSTAFVLRREFEHHRAQSSHSFRRAPK